MLAEVKCYTLEACQHVHRYIASSFFAYLTKPPQVAINTGCETRRVVIVMACRRQITKHYNFCSIANCCLTFARPNLRSHRRARTCPLACERPVVARVHAHARHNYLPSRHIRTGLKKTRSHTCTIHSVQGR